jgi:hypothetical protein
MPSLLAFISRWVPDLGPEHRLAREKIPEFVPEPLRQLYELTGNYPGLFYAQDQLISPDHLRLADGRLAFVWENQGLWTCETLPGLDDPPVFRQDWVGEPNLVEVDASLSRFLATFCLQELVLGAEHLFESDGGEHPEALVTAGLSDLWVGGRYAWGASRSFFLCTDALIMAGDGYLWLGFNDDGCERVLATDTKLKRVR